MNRRWFWQRVCIMSNPLIAPTQDSTKAYSGITLLEDANDLKTAIETGDWASVAMGAVGTALDALSMAMDPFGAILAAGVSWLMEHVGPLKDALNGLTGKPDQIEAQSEKWANVAVPVGGGLLRVGHRRLVRGFRGALVVRVRLPVLDLLGHAGSLRVADVGGVTGVTPRVQH